MFLINVYDLRSYKSGGGWLGEHIINSFIYGSKKQLSYDQRFCMLVCSIIELRDVSILITNGKHDKKQKKKTHRENNKNRLSLS